MKNNKLKVNKGITLIALVVTIVILLIIAVVTITTIFRRKWFNKKNRRI